MEFNEAEIRALRQILFKAKNRIMNKKQKAVILIWILIVVIIGTDPPEYRAFMQGAKSNNPRLEINRVDVPRLLVSWGTVTLAATGLYFLLK